MTDASYLINFMTLLPPPKTLSAGSAGLHTKGDQLCALLLTNFSEDKKHSQSSQSHVRLEEEPSAAEYDG